MQSVIYIKVINKILALVFFSISFNTITGQTSIQFKKSDDNTKPKEYLRLNPFVNEPINWNSIETEITEEKREHYLKRISSDAFFCNAHILDENNFHFLDVNGDQLVDIIYEGRQPPGSELDNIAIFINKGDTIVFLQEIYGSIIELLYPAKNKPVRLTIQVPPCCAIIINQICYYEYHSKQNSVTANDNYQNDYLLFNHRIADTTSSFFALKERYVFITSTDMPKRFFTEDSIRQFEVTADSTSLLTKAFPEPKETHYYDFIPADFQRNIVIAKLAKGHKGKIIQAKKQGKDTYCFIVTSCDHVNSKLSINQKKLTNFMGWVNANDITF